MWYIKPQVSVRRLENTKERSNSMEFPSFTEGTAFVCGVLGIAGVDGYVNNGEGLLCAVCLLAVSGLLAVCAKIGSKNKKK